MTSLTRVAIITRRSIRYSIYGIIFLIIARMLFGVVAVVIKKAFPEPPPPPTVSFSKLPKLDFPEIKSAPQLTYTVETTQGGLPSLGEQATVYFMPKPASHLLALDLAKEKAAGLGFTEEPVKVSQSVYRFLNSRSPAILEMNIITGAFSISYDLAADPEPLNKRPPAPEVATSLARSILSSASLLPADLSGNTSHEFLKVEGKSLTSAVSLSEANLIKINLFRKKYNDLPSLTPNPNEANVWFVISGESTREKQIITGQYHYFAIDENQSATYPIKTSEQAFKELQENKGFIANLGQNSDGKITIRRVYLAYYDSGTVAQFYQPIFVFEGDRSFIAYVPAVTLDYYGQ